MVVFTCGHCGESVNKPKVEKHYLTKCRNRNPNLSCMDCFKDFLGNDYESHTKCITEEERYAGKGFQAKEKKGEKKQNAWVEMLQSVLDEQKDASNNVLRIIETIRKHNNTPRKKPKFINFVKNVCGHKTNPKDIDQAWDLISVKLTALSNNNNNNKQTQNGTTDSAETKSEEKKDLNNGENFIDKDNVEDGEKENVNNGEKENVTYNGNTPVNKHEEKLTKKQRKEEKKKKKYEAELLSAAAHDIEEDTAEKKNDDEGKKSKKNKNKNEHLNGHEGEQAEGKGKNKKRKRLDTVPTVEINDKIPIVETESIKPKEPKKKPKTDAENEAEQSLCLHDQNVANGEVTEKNGKFNWHSVIISVLQKKGNEVPFKRLQKKVLGEYSEYTGDEVDDRIADKFIKKLKSAPNVRVDKNRVLLLED